MRVQFEYDVNDVVDTNARTLFQAPAGRRRFLAMRMTSAACLGLLGGAAVGALVPLPLEGKIGQALTFTLVVAVILWIRYPAAIRRSWRRQYLALLGSEGPFTCEVELRPEGVWASQNQAQVLYEWPGIVSIEQTPDSIDFRSGSGGYLVVRDRAFWSPEERDKFLATARHYHGSYSETDDIR